MLPEDEEVVTGHDTDDVEPEEEEEEEEDEEEEEEDEVCEDELVFKVIFEKVVLAWGAPPIVSSVEELVDT
jgi:hypothetical protein